MDRLQAQALLANIALVRATANDVSMGKATTEQSGLLATSLGDTIMQAEDAAHTVVKLSDQLEHLFIEIGQVAGFSVGNLRQATVALAILGNRLSDFVERRDEQLIAQADTAFPWGE